MKNEKRRFASGLVSPRFAACLLIAAAVCLPSTRGHCETSESVALRGGIAADAPLFAHSVSLEAMSPAASSLDMPVRPRVYHRRQAPSYGPRFRAMISGDIGYGIPAGDWFEGLTSGFSGGAALRCAIADNLYLGFSYKRQWLGVEDSFKEVCSEEGDDCVSLDWDVHLDEFFFVVGWMSPVLDDASPFAYAELGFGGIEHVMDIDASAEDRSASVGSNETKFGMLFAIGGVFPFSKEFGLNVEGDLRLTGEGDDEYDPYYGSYSGTSGILFGFKVGFVAMLGS